MIERTDMRPIEIASSLPVLRIAQACNIHNGLEPLEADICKYCIIDAIKEQDDRVANTREDHQLAEDFCKIPEGWRLQDIHQHNGVFFCTLATQSPPTDTAYRSCISAWANTLTGTIKLAIDKIREKQSCQN